MAETYVTISSLKHYDGKIKEVIAEKQDQLVGTEGQVVSFDADGNVISKDLEKIEIDTSNFVTKEEGKGLFSGSYNDLTDKPEIPSVDGFISEEILNNTLSDYTKQSDIPTSLPASDVFDWAKKEVKPSYTAEEVGADESGSADKALSDAKDYVDEKIDTLVGEGASTTLDTIGEISKAIEEHQDVTNALNSAIGNKANVSDLTSHVNNTDMHITSTERTNWNDTYALKHGHSNISVLNKITQALLDAWNNAVTHISDTIKHITSDERTLWNTVSSKVDKVSGKGLSTNDFTDTDKSKLDGIATGANKTTVDSALSSTSTNPVQNKVVNTALSSKVPTTRTVNGKALSSDITLSASDIGAAESGHTHKYAGSSSEGGSATSAEKLSTANMGSATNPVYFKDGVPAATTYTLMTSVPSGAKFTDTVYTHPTTSGNKHIPSGGSSGQILRWSADGTAVWGADNNTTYSNMTAATSSADGKAGLVPAPAAGAQAKFLRGDGTWQTPTNTTYSNFVKSGSGAKAGLVPAPSTTAGTTKYLREDGTWATPPDTNTTYTLSSFGITATADELNKLDGVTATATELNYVGGVTSNIQTQLDGKAASSHGTHVSYSTTAPVVAGTASVGSASTVSRSDHVHPAQTTVSGNAGSATKLSTARTIDGVSFNGSANITHYGTCSTAAGTAAKTVSLTGFTLATGARVCVKFTVTNTASSPTLNVNSTGAKSIMYRGSAISAGYLAANRVYEFVYDGTDWELIGDIDTNTTYSVVSTSANGLCPKRDGSTTKFLRGDGTWATPPSGGSGSSVTLLNSLEEIEANTSSSNAAGALALKEFLVGETGTARAYGDHTIPYQSIIKIGNLVVGYIQMGNLAINTVGSHPICTLPEGFRPSGITPAIAVGGHEVGGFVLQIGSNGMVMAMQTVQSGTVLTGTVTISFAFMV